MALEKNTLQIYAPVEYLSFQCFLLKSQRCCAFLLFSQSTHTKLIMPGTCGRLHKPSSLTVLWKSPLHTYINQPPRKPAQILPRLTLPVIDTKDRTQ